ncbi:MAG: hypothetical protein MPK62_13170 [Alphaproteobacteria bacterium]|nr:hypothetical protein [Alphaproteobacteria bacterium]
MRVLVLRAPHQARETARRLSLLGHEAISAPVWSFRRAGQPEEVLQKLAEFPRKTDSALILTSANAVRALNAYGLDGKNAYMSDDQNTGDSGERDIYSPNDQNTRSPNGQSGSGSDDRDTDSPSGRGIHGPNDQNAGVSGDQGAGGVDGKNTYRLKERLCRLPVYAVGAETAGAAHKFGFETVYTADGNSASPAGTVRLKPVSYTHPTPPQSELG